MSEYALVRPRVRDCATCHEPHPVGALVRGECPRCAGLVALPLRDEKGRFLPASAWSGEAA
ncbi:hypothetical protein GCM10009539_32970 [Cryptosporangium japonicum]|uniref:Threonine synthase n=1 Tax=Cryptosporangium japonicum TaxID=80872 RepID=A0ABN0UBE0_9ACTN